MPSNSLYQQISEDIKITKLMNALQLQDIMIQQLLHIHVT